SEREMIPNPWKINVQTMLTYAKQLNWDIPQEIDVETTWQIIASNLKEVCRRCVPLKKPGATLKSPPWFDRELKKIYRRRQKRWRTFRTSSETVDYEKYKVIRNEATRLMRQKRATYEQELLMDARANPKRIFRYVNQRKRKRDDIQALKVDDRTISNDYERAEHFAHFFAECFSVPEPATVVNQSTSPESSLEQVVCNRVLVEQLLSSLNPRKAPGYDGFHPRILKELAPVLSAPMTDLFNKSLLTGYLPAEWKLSIIKPFHKGGSKAEVANYRPISLTSVLCKLLEKVVKVSLQNFFRSNSIISPAQHGFVPGRSCLTNLVITREEWVQARDQHVEVSAILFDFSKAFDKVDHNILMGRLANAGVKDPLLSWLHNFLAGRMYAVRVNGTLSNWCSAPSGVPQGTVLGPILFILFVNSLPDVVKAQCAFFADDLKIWLPTENIGSVMQLQAAVDAVLIWAKQNNMALNPSKTVHLAIGRNESNARFYLDGEAIKTVTSARDLGVIISSDLKTHCDTRHKVSTALKRLWSLRRGFQYWCAGTANLAIKTFIRPVLEYAGPASFPCTKGEMAQLERVQRLATRLVPSLRYFTYEERCLQLNLYTIAYRRVRGDMILLFGILRNSKIPEIRQYLRIADRSVLRGHSLHLVAPRTAHMPHQYRFSTRAVKLWNSLPENVIDAPNLATFKTLLDEFLWGKREYLQEKNLHLPGYPAGW
ncbi:MAG: reverse transcriptase family protein, partial [Candidatus Thiodiazotropha sp.]